MKSRRQALLGIAVSSLGSAWLGMGKSNAQTPDGLVLASNTRDVKIDDGGMITDWWLEPATNPDTYTVAFPYKTNRVTYRTDISEHVFDIAPGQEIDFSIVLQGTTHCANRLSAKPRPGPSNFEAVATRGVLTLPMTIRSNRVYLQGSFNLGPELVLQLDLGAAVSAISHRASSRSGVAFDQTATLHNSHGANQARAGSANILKLSHVEWPQTYVIETRNMSAWEDGIIGANAFVNHILELDYAGGKLVIHQDMPVLLDDGAAWTQAPIRLDGGVRPMVEVTLVKGNERHTEWMVLDTGLNGTLVLNGPSVQANQLAQRFDGGLSLAGRQLYNGVEVQVAGQTLPTGRFVGETRNSGLSKSLLGNAWMRNFHTLIDFRQGQIWLKPINRR